MNDVEPLEILYSFPHPVGAPGIGTTALQQVRALSAGGAKVTLVCTSLHAEVPVDVEVHETLRIGGRRIPHRAFGTPDRALSYHDHRVARQLRRTPDRFDVVHVWPQSGLATISAAREAGCVSSREVPNTHTANAFEEAERESKIVGAPLARGHSHHNDSRRLRIEEKEYAQADLLLVPSSYVEKTFLERGFTRDKLKRHQYGFASSSFDSRSLEFLPRRPFAAAFVGRLEPRKGLHYALQAWAAADCPSGSTLRIAGEFVPGYREHVARWLEHPSIQHVGFVDNVAELLCGSDVLLLPSVEEGSALVTYEAQACGAIPLVSTAAGALLPPALEGYPHQPRDVGTLTRQLRRLSRDADLRQMLRREVAAWSTNLTWDAAGQRMLHIYRLAVAEHRHSLDRNSR